MEKEVVELINKLKNGGDEVVTSEANQKVAKAAPSKEEK